MAAARFGCRLCAAAGFSLLALVCPGRAATVEIRVVPTGARVGTEAVASLASALAEARRRRAQDPRAAVTIALGPGLHRIAEPVRLGPGDGGSPEAPLTIRGPADGSARLVGSVRLSPVPLDPALAARLPAAARGRVRAYRLPRSALASPRIQAPNVLNGPPTPPALEVFDDEGAMHPARWPGEGFARAGGPEGRAFTLAGLPPALWRGEADLWAEGYWRWGWLFESLPVAGTTPDADGARLTLDRLPYEGIRPDAPVRIVHALAALDRPGAWWRDAARGLLLAWPRGGDDVEVAVAETLLALDAAAHVRIASLRLEMARGDLVAVRGGRDVVIADSALGRAGGRGVVFTDAAASGLVRCDVTETGGSAVVLEGGDRKTLTPGDLFLRDSRLYGFGRLRPTQHPAIALDGVGAAVTGNLVRGSGAYAIHIRGNDHRIAGNEIADLLQGATDTGAIYAGRDWTARGTVIADNFLHDIRGDADHEVKGIYLDDMASGFTLSGNVFLRVDQPVFIGGGRDNRVEGNLFVASSPAVHVDSRGETWARSAVANPDSELRAAYRAMPVAAASWRARYPGLADLLADRPGVARGNQIAGNVLVASEPFRFNDGAQATAQTVVGNRGPAGLRDAGGDDLSALARTASDPERFAALADRGTGLPRIANARMRRAPVAGAPFAR